jgi:hypothetical protein
MEPWTSSSLEQCASHYAIHIQVMELLETSLLQCLYENPPLQLCNISAICGLDFWFRITFFLNQLSGYFPYLLALRQ